MVGMTTQTRPIYTIMDECKAPPLPATVGTSKSKGKSKIPPPPASFALLRDHVDWEGHVLKSALVDDWLSPFEMQLALAADLLEEDVPAAVHAALQEAVDAAWAFRYTPAGRGDVHKPNLAQLIPTLQLEFDAAGITIHEFLSIREAYRCLAAQAAESESPWPRPFLFMSRNDLMAATVQEIVDDRVEVYFGASVPSADYDELMVSFRDLLVAHGFDVAPYTDMLLTVRNVHWRGALGCRQ